MSVSDVPLYYPNPLFGNSTLEPYSPWEKYQSSELFSFIVDTDDLNDQSSNRSLFISKLHFSWTRTSQFLPFMKTGSMPGRLVYSSHGRRVGSINELSSPLLAAELHSRMPLFQHAPDCPLDTRSETSWTYFMKHFDAFLAGEEFPVPQSRENIPCRS